MTEQRIKAPPQAPINQPGSLWLQTRIGWAAQEIGETLAQDLADSIEEGLASGEGLDDLEIRVADIFDGTAGIDRCQRIARTETMMATNVGSQDGYKSMGITQLKWHTAEDERTCEICDAMDGEEFPIDEFPTPPASSHPDCRCIGQPVKEL